MFIKFREDCIRDVELDDFKVLLSNLSPDDEKDMTVWKGDSKEETLFDLYEGSDRVLSIISGQYGLVAIVGYKIRPGGKSCEMWLVTTNSINQVGKRFLILSSHFFKKLLTRFDYIVGYVDATNQKRIKFIRFCKGKFTGNNITVQNGDTYLEFIIN